MKKLAPASKTESSDKPYVWDPRPCLNVKKDDLPAIEDWKVGKEYDVIVRVKMEEYRSGLNSDTGKEETRAELRVIAIGVEEKE